LEVVLWLLGAAAVLTVRVLLDSMRTVDCCCLLVCRLCPPQLQAVGKMLAGQGMQGGSTGGRRSSSGGSVRASSGGGAGPSSSAADSDGFSFASLLGRGQGADITPGEFEQVRAALQGLRRRWDAVAAAAADEAAPRQSQRFSAATQQFRQTQEVTRMQVLQRIARVGLTSEGPAQVGAEASAALVDGAWAKLRA
jgi:hypothetical protein